MEKKLAIIHYNTPELTEACILSIRKQGCDAPILLFDNSDKRPFKKRMKGVKRIDNTKGKVIDFDKFLEQYPDREPRYAMLSNFGSAKHIRTVQELWKLLPGGFILVESDTLLMRNPLDLWKEEFAAVGHVQWHQHGNLCDIPRYEPFLLYMNVPKLTAAGVSFFDPKRCWALQKGEMTRGNWYDTGASLFEDVRNTKPALVGLNFDTRPYIVHYHGGSWRDDDHEKQILWLSKLSSLWMTDTIKATAPMPEGIQFR